MRNAPDSEESSSFDGIPKKEGAEQRHPKLPPSIHPFPPLNGQRKDKIHLV